MPRRGNALIHSYSGPAHLLWTHPKRLKRLISCCLFMVDIFYDLIGIICMIQLMPSSWRIIFFFFSLNPCMYCFFPFQAPGNNMYDPQDERVEFHAQSHNINKSHGFLPQKKTRKRNLLQIILESFRMIIIVYKIRF